MSLRIMTALLVLLPATWCNAASNTYSIGMMNWLEQPITNPTDLTSFIDCCTSTSSPSIAGGWIIQEAAGVADGNVYYADLDHYLTQVDNAHLFLSFNYADDSWTNLPGHNTASVQTNVQNLLTYLAQTTVTLAHNVDSHGTPTIDINLDVEPKGSATAADWISMATAIRSLITAHNASNPSIHVTLSAFVASGFVTELITDSLIDQAWQPFDTLIVMAYRNLPCFTAQCSGTNSTPCADGFARFGSQLADTAPAGKYCSIALELSLNVGHCNKISFGTTGIYNNTGATDKVQYRNNFLKKAMDQGWDLLTPDEQSRFHPHGAFIMHSYEWFSCFRDQTQPTGGSACQPQGDCDLASACIPTLATHEADVNGDGVIDEEDIEIIENLIGSCSGDLDRNGHVDVLDLLGVIDAWGTCP